MLTQLLQWPPKSTTVIGAGLLFGVGCYLLTGSVEAAIAVAGVFKMLCPQDAPATDQLIDALNKVPTLVRRTAPALALALALAALVACSGPQLATAERQAAAAQPAIAVACNAAMALAPAAGPVAPWIIGGCATEAAVAKLALDPSSLDWVNGLIAQAKGQA